MAFFSIVTTTGTNFAKKTYLAFFFKKQENILLLFKKTWIELSLFAGIILLIFPRLFFQYNCLLVLCTYLPNHKLYKIFNFHYRLFKIKNFWLDNSCNNSAVIATLSQIWGEEKNLTRKVWPDQWTGSLYFPNLNLLSIYKNSFF